MNTTDIGDLAELKFLLAFKERNIPISIPFGNNQAYDMIVDINGNLLRFQIKNAAIRNECIRIKLCSDTYDLSNGRGRKSKSYKNKADFIGAYCADNNNFYVLNIEDFGVSSAYLRVAGGNFRSKYAKDYTLDTWLLNYTGALVKRYHEGLSILN